MPRPFALGLPSLLTAALALAACGDDGRQTSGSADDGINPPPTSTGTSGDTEDTGSGTAVDTTDGTCPDAQVCGDTCCEAGQTCQDGECVLDCGAAPPCGDVCCGDGQVCYVGQCITPGNPCNAAVCATTVQSDCNDDEICDAQLGQCVPNFADPTCAFEPEVGVFDPVPRFTWGRRQQRSCDLGCQKEEICNAGFCEPTWPHVTPADDDMPDAYQVVMSPMVADLDLDCVPEIIFNSYAGSQYTTNGVLRAISGNDGSKVWTLDDPAYETDSGSHPAIGDIDGDGMPEVIVPSETNTLIAVQGATGTPIWVSQPYTGGGKSGSPSIANFDNAGNPEIAFGHNVFDSS
ncbi:MAG: VCBS repeat-containing protein, partial [Myxococcales bacterium]|nr:VCBS repeat-containing protein [Myxococcales bacterium]